MSHYDNLPIEIQTYIGHYIPYKHPIQDLQKLLFGFGVRKISI